MIRIAIIEDEEKEQKYLLECLDLYKKERSLDFDIRLFSDGLSFLDGYKGYDIVFMDIELPNCDGMTTAQRLREIDSTVCLIFVTKSVKYAIKGYEVNAKYYLVKPIKYYPFSVKLDKVIQMARKAQQVISVKTTGREGTRLVRLVVDEIFYIQVRSNYVRYYTASGEYEERNVMKAIEKELAPAGFGRCNNYCLVNLKHVSEIGKDSIVVNGETLEISRARKKEFLDAVTKYAWRVW